MSSLNILTDPIIEGTGVPPGVWANRAKDCPWDRCRRQSEKMGTLLNSLKSLPLLRKPTVKCPVSRGTVKWPWTGPTFDLFIGSRKANGEALLAQSTGVLLEVDKACTHCRVGEGIFDGCVQVAGQRNCANCQIGGRYERCSLMTMNEVDSTEVDTEALRKLIDLVTAEEAELVRLLSLKRKELQDLENAMTTRMEEGQKKL